MEKEFEYYRITAKIDHEDIPLLQIDDDSPIYQYSETPIENPEMIYFRFKKPTPKKPRMVDYLSLPSSVISQKIYNILYPLDIDGIQLLPAIIRGKNDTTFNNYWLLNIYNVIKCIDTELSECKIEDISIENVKKIVLDKVALQKIPLKKRLIFRMKEDWSFQLVHVSILDKIMERNPEGVKFTNIEKWTHLSSFEH